MLELMIKFYNDNKKEITEFLDFLVKYKDILIPVITISINIDLKLKKRSKRIRKSKTSHRRRK